MVCMQYLNQVQISRKVSRGSPVLARYMYHSVEGNKKLNLPWASRLVGSHSMSQISTYYAWVTLSKSSLPALFIEWKTAYFFLLVRVGTYTVVIRLSFLFQESLGMTLAVWTTKSHHELLASDLTNKWRFREDERYHEAPLTLVLNSSTVCPQAWQTA